MGTQNFNAPPCAQSADDRPETPTRRSPSQAATPAAGFGVVHEASPHSCCFTVVGNHLAQHRELSLLAIGLGVHIQSLPAGAQVDIKSLAARFPEGPVKIAAGLRELETHHYLRREHERTPDGRIITRTLFRNQPTPCRHQAQPPADAGPPHDVPFGAPETTTPEPEPETVPDPEQAPESEPVDPQAPETASGQRPRAPRKERALPVLPTPLRPTPQLLNQATHILTGLQRHDHRLALSETDTHRLAPAVAAWLERDTTPAAISYALTAGIRSGEPVRHPAGFLAYRLIVQLPAPRPFHKPAPEPPAPLRTCDRCGLAYRSPQPDTCPCHTRATTPAPPTAPDTASSGYAAQGPLSEAAERIKQRVEHLAHEAQHRAAAAPR